MAKRRKRYMTKRRIAEIQKRKQLAALFIVSAFMISGIISLSLISNTSMLSKTKGSVIYKGLANKAPSISYSKDKNGKININLIDDEKKGIKKIDGLVKYSSSTGNLMARNFTKNPLTNSENSLVDKKENINLQKYSIKSSTLNVSNDNILNKYFIRAVDKNGNAARYQFALRSKNGKQYINLPPRIVDAKDELWEKVYDMNEPAPAPSSEDFEHYIKLTIKDNNGISSIKYKNPKSKKYVEAEDVWMDNREIIADLRIEKQDMYCKKNNKNNKEYCYVEVWAIDNSSSKLQSMQRVEIVY